MLFAFSTLFAQPANDDMIDATLITIGSTVSGATNVNATLDYFGASTPQLPDVQCGSENTHNSVWYKFVGTGEPVNITSCSPNTNFDVDLGILTAFEFFGTLFPTCVTGASSSAPPAEADCAFGGSSNALASLNSVDTEIGLTYYIRVASHTEGSTGSFDLEIQSLVPAPITLVGLWASTWDKGNSISWETSSEENVLWHVIERSSTGFGDWTEVGKLVAQNSARNGAYYELVDNEPFNFTYYRLRTVDHDGSEQVSKVVTVKRDRPEFDIKKIYPNPIMEGDITIQIDSDRNEEINVRIVDVSGKSIQQFNYQVRDGLNQIQIDVTDWRSGVYFAQFQSIFFSRNQFLVEVPEFDFPTIVFDHPPHLHHKSP